VSGGSFCGFFVDVVAVCWRVWGAGGVGIVYWVDMKSSGKGERYYDAVMYLHYVITTTSHWYNCGKK
jgi:hypothetical protein